MNIIEIIYRLPTMRLSSWRLEVLGAGVQRRICAGYNKGQLYGSALDLKGALESNEPRETNRSPCGRYSSSVSDKGLSLYWLQVQL